MERDDLTPDQELDADLEDDALAGPSYGRGLEGADADSADEDELEGRFSTGMEELPPTPEKEAERRFSEGQELEDRVRQGDEQVLEDDAADADDEDDGGLLT